MDIFSVDVTTIVLYLVLSAFIIREFLKWPKFSFKVAIYFGKKAALAHVAVAQKYTDNELNKEASKGMKKKLERIKAKYKQEAMAKFNKKLTQAAAKFNGDFAHMSKLEILALATVPFEDKKFLEMQKNFATWLAVLDIVRKRTTAVIQRIKKQQASLKAMLKTKHITEQSYVETCDFLNMWHMTVLYVKSEIDIADKTSGTALNKMQAKFGVNNDGLINWQPKQTGETLLIGELFNYLNGLKDGVNKMRDFEAEEQKEGIEELFASKVELMAEKEEEPKKSDSDPEFGLGGLSGDEDDKV